MVMGTCWIMYSRCRCCSCSACRAAWLARNTAAFSWAARSLAALSSACFLLSCSAQ